MSYARVLDDAIYSLDQPPELLEPTDVTANGQWYDLRHHDYTLLTWEVEVIGPHGWLSVVPATKPPNTDTTVFEYSVEMIDGVPTEVWTERPKTEDELLVEEKSANVTQMTAESAEAVDKLVLVVENLNLITDMTNAEINANPAAIIKDVARELKTVARQVNREARMTSDKTEDTFTGTEETVP